MDFNQTLNTKVAEVERPPLIPVGTYRARVKKVAGFETTKDGKWQMLDFPMGLLEPVDGVDPDDLQAYGGLGPNAQVRRRFMFNTEDDAAFKRTLFDLRRFLEQHLKCASEQMSLKEAINAALNAECLVFVRWTPDKTDPEVQYNEIGRTAPLE